LLETSVIEAEKNDRATQITLGLLLKKIESRIFDGLYIKKGGRQPEESMLTLDLF
jgi:hypothetical protein